MVPCRRRGPNSIRRGGVVGVGSLIRVYVSDGAGASLNRHSFAELRRSGTGCLEFPCDWNKKFCGNDRTISTDGEGTMP